MTEDASTLKLPDVLPATPVEPPPEAGLVTNSTIEAQLDHRSFRAYTDEPVGEDVVATLLEVARHGATSGFHQFVTIIRVQDPKVREAVYQSSGQPYVGGDRGELFVFVVDLSRNARVRREAGESLTILGKSTLFLVGVEDTMISAQNVVVAAESLGLGTVLLGSIGADPEALIEALNLPDYTFPLLGLLVGHPAQSPQLKPRLPREITTSVDTYPDFESEAYRDAWESYDQTIRTYYDLREGGRRQDSFTLQSLTKPGAGKAEQTDLLAILHKQGLCLY